MRHFGHGGQQQVDPVRCALRQHRVVARGGKLGLAVNADGGTHAVAHARVDGAARHQNAVGQRHLAAAKGFTRFSQYRGGNIRARNVLHLNCQHRAGRHGNALQIRRVAADGDVICGGLRLGLRRRAEAQHQRRAQAAEEKRGVFEAFENHGVCNSLSSSERKKS